MSLKDQINSDLASVFLNALEFAEDVQLSVAGEVPVTVMAILEEGSDDDSVYELGDGTLLFTGKLYVRTEDLHSRPKAGKDMAINGRPCRVLNTSEEMGIFVITFERADS